MTIAMLLNEVVTVGASAASDLMGQNRTKIFSLVLVFFFSLEPAAANDAVVGKRKVCKRAQQLGSVQPLDVDRGEARPRLEKW